MAHRLLPLTGMASVRELIDRFCEAWNAHDPDALAAVWAEDGELNHPWGFHAVGRDAIRELLTREHRGAMAATTIRVDALSESANAANAFADVAGVLENVSAPNGRPYSMPYEFSAMFVRGGDGWLIRTMTPMANPR
jgi:uncharacterized protein (TIGR02246 family)